MSYALKKKTDIVSIEERKVIINNVLRVEDRGFTYYLGVIEPAQIMQLTFVPCEISVASLDNVLNVRSKDGYQREGDISRMKKIKTHYQGSDGSLIPPVLLSTRGRWQFVPSKTGSHFGSISAEDCAAIIDGQHRLGGLSLLAADVNGDSETQPRKIPFMAAEFTDIENEKLQFEIINDEQKGIPKSHLKFINKGGSFAGIVAYALREAEDSVFSGRIGVATRKDWELITFGAAESLVSLTFDAFFCQNAFRPGEGSKETQAKGLRVLLIYWQTVEKCFPELWSDMKKMPQVGVPKSSSFPGRNKFKYRLLEETGLRAFAKLGSKVLNSAYLRESGDIAWETVERILSDISRDEIFNVAFQKKTKENISELIGIDPELQYQGNAGVPALWRVLEGAFERVR